MKPLPIILPLLAVLAAAATATGPVQAAPGIATFAAKGTVHADDALVTGVGENDLRDLVLAAGDTVDALHPLDEPSVRGKTSDGLKYLLVAADCPAGAQTGCESIMMQVRYDADKDVTLKGINDANYNEAAIGTWWYPDNQTVGFTRFVYLKGGVTWANLKANVRMMIDTHYTASASVWPE